ncbi:MAG: RNA polymerase sigma factor [Planctomycetota bacterium]|jgi:RNA polymerase sigma-70 factor (ECF subfamily)
MAADRTHDEELLAHAGFLRALALGLLGDAHQAEDVAQEALVVGLENGASARRGLRAWLAGVTRNLALMRRRAETRRRRHEAAAVQMGKMDSPDDLAARLETQRRLVEAVQELREPYQSTVVARFYDGLKPKEIARRQSVPVDTVRTRLQRAVEQLRRRLDERHGGDRRAWMLALLPFTLKKGFLPAVGAGAGAATSVGTAASVKAAVAVVTIAAVAAVVVVFRGTTGSETPPAPDTIPAPGLPTPVRARAEPAPESGTTRRGAMDAREYLRRINAGEGAYGVALEICSLPPEQGRRIALAIFADIRSWARRHEVQKAFVTAGHPHALSVLVASGSGPRRSSTCRTSSSATSRRGRRPTASGSPATAAGPSRTPSVRTRGST